MKLTFVLITAFLWLNAAALPVQFYTLSAEVENQQVNIYWSTISETANQHFVIQRSPNGEDWMDIGTVDGSINSSTLVQYEYADNELFPFKVYYRIKQIDLSGMAHFSEKLKIGRPEQYFTHVKSFPNPATNELNIPLNNAPEGTEIIVLNSLGAEIYRKTMGAQGINTIDLTPFTKGFYYLKLSFEGNENIQRFFKQ